MMNTNLICSSYILLATFLWCVVCQDENIENKNSLSETNVDEISTETLVNTTISKDGALVDDTEKANKTLKFVNCLTGMGNPVVQLTNDTELIKLLQPDLNVTDREVPSLCVVVLFYSKYCPFSSLAAPPYNALSRAFPDIKVVAINAMMYQLLNTQNGIVGVPSLILFHNGKSIAKYNDSEYTLELFSQFITRHTGITAAEKSTVTSADFAGPVTYSPVKGYDFFLIISYMFIIICAGYYFTKSKCWKWIIETVQSNWRESEAHAQHEHLE